jgi:hypothetical protein
VAINAVDDAEFLDEIRANFEQLRYVLLYVAQMLAQIAAEHALFYYTLRLELNAGGPGVEERSQ